jgi:Ran GTPase-activating protein (RanGAP) involved in mRNA processing and transport
MSEPFLDAFFIVAPFLSWKDQLSIAHLCKAVNELLPQALVTLEVCLGTLQHTSLADLLAKYWRLDKLVIYDSIIEEHQPHFDELVSAFCAKPSHLTTLKFEHCEFRGEAALEGLMRALGDLPRLSSLVVAGKNEVHCSLNALLALKNVINSDNFASLSILNFSHNRTDLLEATLISQIVQAKPALVELSMEGMAMGSELALFEPMFASMTKLEKLSVASNGLHSEGAQVLQRLFCEDHSALIELNISSNWLTEAGVSALKFSLPRLGSLHTLDISRNKLGERGGSVLAECISQCRSLEVFRCADNQLKSAVVALTAGLAQLPSLSELNLSVNSIGPEHSVSFAAELMHLQALKSLNVLQNRLASGFYDIAAVLGSTHIERLEARSNQIDDFGLNKLGKCLGELTYIDLSMNELSFKGLEAFLAVAQSSKLQKLNLRLQNQVQPTQRELLKTLVPKDSRILTRI